jgi:hypothetical protein
MFKALRFFGWPLLAGVLIALLIIQRYPQWVGLPSLDVNLQQAPQTSYVQQGPGDLCRRRGARRASRGQPVHHQGGEQKRPPPV